jgi:peptide/nickel transport system substrate-binding protein
MRVRLLLFALCTLALAACGRESGGAWGAPHQLRIGLVSDPSSLNPLFVTSQNAVDLGQLYTETLVGLSPQNQVIPLIAQRIPTRANGDISRDGLMITYRLRHEERFADGLPLTSADVAFTYRAILDPRNPVTSTEPYKQIASLTTPDPYTVRIRLRHRWAAATTELFAVSDYVFGILPAHAFHGSTDLSRSSWNERPFGSGPFLVDRWVHGDRIVLRPNPYARRKPHLSQLVFKIVPDQNTLFIQLRTHAVDVADLNDSQAIRARSMRGIRLVETPQNHTDFIELQTQRPPTNNPLLRHALIEAIDRKAILKNVFYGLHPSATTEIPSTLWAHDASIKAVPFDPQRARVDLAKAGWKPGGLVDLAYIGTDQANRELTTIVQANLANVGVKAVLHTYPSTIYYAPAQSGGIERGGRFNVSYTDWFGGADPEQSETYRCADRAPAGPNTSRWCDPRYDKLYRVQAESLDRAARLRAFYGMQQLVHDAAIADFLAYQSLYTAINPAVQGYQPNMLFKWGSSELWDVL